MNCKMGKHTKDTFISSKSAGVDTRAGIWCNSWQFLLSAGLSSAGGGLPGVKMARSGSRYSFDVPNPCINFATLSDDDVHNADSWFGKLFPTPWFVSSLDEGLL